MESQQKKRFRGDGNSESTELSSGNPPSNLADSNEDPKFVEAIPELVSVIFLQYLRDVRMLKTCRLVSKSWNIYASESLRTCSKVFLREGNPAFTKLLVQRALGQLQDLPSPFQNFHLGGWSFIDPTFQTLISLPNISITSLNLILDGDKLNPDESQLRRLLTANQTKIENLTITAYEGEACLNDDFLQIDGIKLTSLKSLEIEDQCKQCKHVGLLKSFLRMCQPEWIDLSFEDSASMHSVLLEANVENVKRFELYSEFSMPSWEYLETIKFSKLRNLTLVDWDLSRSDNLPLWDSICQKISPLLEELDSNVPISPGPELKFLNLKTIQVSMNSALSSLTHAKFPSLENVTVCCDDTDEYPLVEDISYPHLGVQSLGIMIHVDDFHDTPFHRELMTLLMQASRQFPKVPFLKFTISTFDSTTVTVGDIFETFPKLTKLSLDGRCNFLEFSGMDIATIAEYIERGGSIENIPHKKSITDFMELETIVLGSRFVVDPDMVRYCLPRVPKLREVSLHWNKSLSASLLRDCIGHLERIILNTESRGFEDALAHVAEVLPNACRK